ncbi:MAG: hypothetical protein Q4E12_00400, partial [Coriobacteriia bacterium]|nr:hypothetical protein [Coriobacteriia bacterium]
YVQPGETLLIQPVNGGAPLYYTDSYFKIDQVFRGEINGIDTKANNGEVVFAVRQLGGSDQGAATVSDSSAVFKQGESYLLFLYAIPDGSDYNTEGEHFYLVSGSGGAWAVAADGAFAKPDGTTVVSAEQVQEAVNTASPETASERYLKSKEAYLEDLRSLVEKGELPEESYQQAVAEYEKEATSYATIVSKG